MFNNACISAVRCNWLQRPQALALRVFNVKSSAADAWALPAIGILQYMACTLQDIDRAITARLYLHDRRQPTPPASFLVSSRLVIISATTHLNVPHPHLLQLTSSSTPRSW